MLITAAFEAQYAPGMCQLMHNPWQGTGQTCCWSSYETKLACEIYYASPVTWSPIVSWEKILFEHLLDFSPRSQPQAAVVDACDSIESGSGHFVGPLVVAQDT